MWSGPKTLQDALIAALPDGIDRAAWWALHDIASPAYDWLRADPAVAALAIPALERAMDRRGPDTLIACAGCGRRVPDWAMTDMRGTACERLTPDGFACDACREGWLLRRIDVAGEPLTRWRLAVMLGAPPEAVDQAAAQGERSGRVIGNYLREGGG